MHNHPMQSGQPTTEQEAVRRMLILESTGLRGQSCITQSLYQGLQVIMPSKFGPNQRHTQCALRFVVEATAPFPQSTVSAPR